MSKFPSCVAAGLLGLSLPASAENFHEIGLVVGSVNTVTDYSFAGPGLRYEFGTVQASGQYGVEVRYTGFLYEVDDYAKGGPMGDYDIAAFEVGFKYAKPMTHASPYVVIGLGHYTFEDPSSYDYDALTGFHLAGGVEFLPERSKQLQVFAQLRYTQATDDLEDNRYGTEYGIDGVGFDVGVGWRF